MQTKSPFASKTVWFNALTSAAALLTAAVGFIPPPALPYVMAVQGLINVGLRFMTTEPIR